MQERICKLQGMVQTLENMVLGMSIAMQYAHNKLASMKQLNGALLGSKRKFKVNIDSSDLLSVPHTMKHMHVS